MRTHFTRSSAAVLSAVLLLAACGGDDDPVAEDSTTDETTDEATDEATDDETDEATDEEVAVTDATNGTLELAYILPETGQLAFLGPPMIAATELAVEDINAAGGVLGNDVTLATGDEAGDASVASQSASRLLGQGVDAIIGAASSGMSLAIIDQVTGNGVLQCSPSNTSATFSAYDDGGLYFRTAPSDALQGPVLANTVIADGITNPAILARGDDYGNGLADSLEAALLANGATVADKIIYDAEAANFDAEVEQAQASGADAIIVISFEEGAQILTKMIADGVGPADFPVYGADGINSADFPSKVDPENLGAIDGLKGTSPQSGASDAFVERLKTEKGVSDTLFGAESYDCVITIALATMAAESDAGEDIAEAMIDVTTEGTECEDFASCSALLADGEDINYQGKSGVVDYNSTGEPGLGFYEVYTFSNGGERSVLSVEESRLS